MEKTKIKWRLNQLPTTDELRELVKDKIITQEEARQILFTEETKEDVEKQDLAGEIKFLKELVNKLSEGRVTRIVETIREVEKPYKVYPWWGPYGTFTCGTLDYTGATGTSVLTIGGNTTLTTGGTTSNPFDI